MKIIIKMKNALKFQLYYYNIKNIITPNDISSAINRFYLENLLYIDDNMKLVIIFKVKLENGDIVNISTIQIVDKLGIDKVKYIFSLFWSHKACLYKNNKIEKIIFTYRFIESFLVNNKNIFNYPTDFDKNETVLPEDYKDLPNNRLFMEWGTAIEIMSNNICIASNDDDYLYYIIQLGNEYFVTISYKDEKLYHFHDIFDCNTASNDTFIRSIGNFKLYYFEGNCHILN